MKIPFYIESKNGHDTEEVPKQNVQAEAEKHLRQDKLVTIEQGNEESEILTKTDIPKQTETPTDEEQKENKAWAKKFKETKSATITKKSRGA